MSSRRPFSEPKTIKPRGDEKTTWSKGEATSKSARGVLSAGPNGYPDIECYVNLAQVREVLGTEAVQKLRPGKRGLYTSGDHSSHLVLCPQSPSTCLELSQVR